MTRCILLSLAIVLLVSSSDPVCDLEIEAGDCRGSILSYGYDKDSGTCIPFTYGGCGGNGNRFSEPEKCESACLGAPLLPD
ncbi:hypothetical protein V3C99_012969 [Haemonchus contortus]